MLLRDTPSARQSSSILLCAQPSPPSPRQVALARSTLPESVAQEARTVLLGMGHTMSLSNLRFMAYLMQKILVQVYDDVLVDAAELNQIHEAAQQMPVLLLPTHRSYMDFLIISLLFFFEGLPVPAIAGWAGEVVVGRLGWGPG